MTPAGYALIGTGAMVGPEQATTLGYLDTVTSADSLESLTAGTVARLKDIDLGAHAATTARVRGALRDEVLAAGLR